MKKEYLTHSRTGIFFALLLTIAFCFLADPDARQNFFSGENEFTVSGMEFSAPIVLKPANDHLLKLKFQERSKVLETVSLNGVGLELKFSNESEDRITRYYYIPGEIVNADDNRLQIHFYLSKPSKIEIRTIIAFSRNRAGRKNIGELILSAIFFFAFSLFVWRFLAAGAGKLFSRSAVNALSFLPCLFVFVFFGVGAAVSTYAICVTISYLFVFFFALTLFSNFLLNLVFLFCDYGDRFNAPEMPQRYALKFRGMLRIFKKARAWKKLLLLFVLCFTLSWFLLMLCLTVWAQHVAVVAYIALFLGAVLRGWEIRRVVREEKS